MKDLIIIGTGDFSREVSWMVERINIVNSTWNLLGFVDNNPTVQGKKIDGYYVLGTLSYLEKNSNDIYVICSIGTGQIRKKVMDQVCRMSNMNIATLIDPEAIVGRNTKIAEGCIICAGSIITTNASLGRNVIINLNCSVGHDAILDECCTVHPGSNISGKVHVEHCVDIGTGTKIIQGKSICNNCILGAGAVVIKDITVPGTYVGVPAKRKEKE